MLTKHAAPLREQAVTAIRERIIDNTYPPGLRLKEKDLCEALDVSRTVIREALRQLESENLVRIEPNVGPVVVTLARQDILDLYETRAMLEGTAAKLAARKASPNQIAGLFEVYDQIVLCSPVELSRLIELKNTLYDQLLSAAGNRVIAEVFHNVQARISQLRRLTLGSGDRHQQMLAELSRVLVAIRDGDADAAYSATVVHVKAAETIALQGFDSATI